MFYIVQVIFTNGKHSYLSFPVTNNALSTFTNMLENSKDVVVFQVVDGIPVDPSHFGFGGYNKWVLHFKPEHFRY